MSERRLPPVTLLGMASLALIVIGGHIPSPVSLGPAWALLGASALLLAINFTLLVRAPGFNWTRFFAVARWAFLAYAVIAGMIIYTCVRNHVPGGGNARRPNPVAARVRDPGPDAHCVHRRALRRRREHGISSRSAVGAACSRCVRPVPPASTTRTSHEGSATRPAAARPSLGAGVATMDGRRPRPPDSARSSAG